MCGVSVRDGVVVGGGGEMEEQQTQLVLGEGNAGLKRALAVTQGASLTAYFLNAEFKG